MTTGALCADSTGQQSTVSFPLYLTKPAMRTALKGLMDTPREWTAFLGYALLAGRKAAGSS